MVDALPESTRAELDDPFAQLTGPLASTTRLDFEVVDAARLTPHMQRLRLTAPQLDGFGYLPGQDVMLLVAAEGNRPVRRRYTIRQLDTAARLLTLDIVLHGDGPGERWVRSARPGDTIEGDGVSVSHSPADAEVGGACDELLREGDLVAPGLPGILYDRWVGDRAGPVSIR
jgi:NADPH-dependent ferric siderophore reductase